MTYIINNFIDEPTISVYNIHAGITRTNKDKAVGRFYRKHELAIWSTFVISALFIWWLLLHDNANILWRLSTPVMEWLP